MWSLTFKNKKWIHKKVYSQGNWGCESQANSTEGELAWPLIKLLVYLSQRHQTLVFTTCPTSHVTTLTPASNSTHLIYWCHYFYFLICEPLSLLSYFLSLLILLVQAQLLSLLAQLLHLVHSDYGCDCLQMLFPFFSRSESNSQSQCTST